MRHSELLSLSHELMGGTVSGQYILPDHLALVADRGEGAHLYDVRGRRYIDYMLGSGPVILGHAHPEVVDAIVNQAEKGSTFYTLNAPAIELARRVTEVVPCAEQVKFASSGTEATFYALRMARAFSGKPKVLKFAGGFHGVHDVGMMNAFTEPDVYPHPTPDSAGVPEGVGTDVIVARWNDPNQTKQLIRDYADQLAAVICEPMQRTLVAAPGFLQMLRDVTSEYGVLLIFDEVVTGFRFALGGAQERYGVVPDLATFGKALTNGLPMTAITGRREVIEVTKPAKDEGAPSAYFGNTLNGNPLCSAAGLATINVLSQPGVYQQLESVTGKIKDGIFTITRNLGIGVQILGDGPVFQLVFADHPIRDLADLQRADAKLLKRFLLGCADRGVLSSGKFYVSVAHDDADVVETLDVISAVLTEMSS